MLSGPSPEARHQLDGPVDVLRTELVQLLTSFCAAEAGGITGLAFKMYGGMLKTSPFSTALIAAGREGVKKATGPHALHLPPGTRAQQAEVQFLLLGDSCAL